MVKKLVVALTAIFVGLTIAPVAAQAAPTKSSASSASAARSGPSRAQLARVVKAVAFERVYGSNYGHYKKLYPRAINWRNDGCSVPKSIESIKGVGWVLKHYSNVFQKSCDRHDFGYRNYGKHDRGLALDSTPARKAAIDNRFHSNMKYQCLKVYNDWYDVPAREVCYKAADIFYDAVKYAGGGSFY